MRQLNSLMHGYFPRVIYVGRCHLQNNNNNMLAQAQFVAFPPFCHCSFPIPLLSLASGRLQGDYCAPLRVPAAALRAGQCCSRLWPIGPQPPPRAAAPHGCSTWFARS